MKDVVEHALVSGAMVSGGVVLALWSLLLIRYGRAGWHDLAALLGIGVALGLIIGGTL
jgi:hypothetical protein